MAKHSNAFSTKQKNTMLSSVNSLASHAISFHTPPPLNADEIYRGLIKPDHLAKLEEVNELVETVQSHNAIYIPVQCDNGQVKLTIAFHSGALQKLLPRYANSDGFHDKADVNLLARIQAWVARRYYIGLGYTKVRQLINTLDEELTAPVQVRFYFEGILTILKADEATHKLAAKLAPLKLPGRLPSISPELRAAGIEATKFLAQMALLPNEKTNEEVPIGLAIGGFGNIKFDWAKYPTNIV